MNSHNYKKVLLITLHGANIGNRLQNYALQYALEKRGCYVYNAVYVKHFLRVKSIIKFLLYCMGVKKYYLREKAKREEKKLNEVRDKRFQEFTDTYIHNQINVSYFNWRVLPINDFDFAITGSDQVWHNWDGSKKELYYFYLMFIDKEKRASYAPSFGFSDVPKRDINLHKKGILEMKYLSCREAKGVEIIKKLTGRSSSLVPDPTMLLSCDEWKTISRKPEYEIPEKYMLIYFLGGIDEKYNETVNRLITERNCIKMDILTINDMEKYSTDPSEFLWLVEHADCVCTDSFHACVFSIIFEKDFMAFPRIEGNGMNKMFDRIEHLLEIYNLKNHIWTDVESQIISVTEADNIKEKLSEQAQIGFDYLDNIISNI